MINCDYKACVRVERAWGDLADSDIKVHIHKVLSGYPLRLVYFLFCDLSKKIMVQKKLFLTPRVKQGALALPFRYLYSVVERPPH